MSFQFKGFGNNEHDWQTLDRFNLLGFDDPAHYSLEHEPDLVAAVNTALDMGLPLLVTGEPGVGKTSLAGRLAWELGVERLDLRIKSTTEGTDLLYRVDHLRRMSDSQVGGEAARRAENVRHYLQFTGLGKAILRTWPGDLLKSTGLLSLIWPGVDAADVQPQLSVVLIDEIDKADANVPNDLLEELRTFTFQVPELDSAEGWPAGQWIGIGGYYPAPPTVLSDAVSRLRPVVLITSNAERNLPEAFLRRCAYYHMALPQWSDAEDADSESNRRYDLFRQTLFANVRGLLGPDADQSRLQSGLDTFERLRASRLQRSPSTGELFAWLAAIVEPRHLHLREATDAWNRLACRLMVKRHDDLQRALSVLAQEPVR